MGPIDILGELLGRKAKKPGRDGSVFDDMFSKGTASQRSTPGPSNTGDIDAQAKELEDLLNVAKHQRSQAHPTSAGAQSGGTAEYSWAEASERSPNEQAIVWIRAMVNAA